MGLFILSSIFAIYAFILFFYRWVPTHDALNVLHIAHYFTRGLAAAPGWEVPLWAPYLDFGKPMNLQILAAFSPSFFFLVPIVKIFPSIPPIYLLFTAQLMNDLILILGTYLFSRRLFEMKETAFFVTICMLGTAIWTASIHFNYCQYYSIPLCLYLIRTGCEERSLFKLLLTAFVLGIAFLMGNALYIGIPMILVCSTYFITTLYEMRITPVGFFEKGEHSRTILIAFLLCLLICSGAMFLFHGELPQFVSPSRLEDGQVSLHTFQSNYHDKWIRNFTGMVFGLENVQDATAYAGLFVIPFVLIAILFRARRSQIPLIASGVVLLLLYLGEASFFTTLIYPIPGISYFRHIGNIVPPLKCLLIVLAGFGFDGLVKALKRGDKRNFLKRYFWVMLFFFLWIVLELRDHGRNARQLLAILILGFSLIAFWYVGWRGRRFHRKIVPVLLLLVGVDVLSFRIWQTNLTMQQVSRPLWELYTRMPSPVFISQRFEKPDVPEVLWEDLRFARINTNLIQQAFDWDLCDSLARSDTALKEIVQLQKRRAANVVGDLAYKEMTGCALPKLQLHGVSHPSRVDKWEFQVLRFNYHALILRVHNPLNEDGLLYYADAFNKNWTGFVNDRPGILSEANSAFKEMRVPPGVSTVEWSYLPKPEILSFWGLWVSSALFLVGIAIQLSIRTKKGESSGR